MSNLWGSFGGNLLGTLYFLYYQVIGILTVTFFLSKKGKATCLLCGSVLGSVLFSWMPALFAFFFKFSVTAHILAAIAVNIPLLLCAFTERAHREVRPDLAGWKALFQKHYIFFLLFNITLLAFCMMLSSHTLLPKEDGLHTGQCAYGDMNMHLGFITSIARQQTFPPYYSISPGDKLCYPFLCDSNSSSIYLFGASLRYAYMLPMVFAIMQVMAGFYCFAYTWLKKASKAALAWFLFFFNGGLGFVYFLDWSKERTYYFKNIFTEYYQTPTNLIDQNIRWVNIIVDMLLPQRATLFGYAVLFTCLWLLWRAVFRKETELFPLAALLTAALPMIHTHSFLSMGLISAAWLLMDLSQQTGAFPKRRFPGKMLLCSFLAFMCILQILIRKGLLPEANLLYICLFVLALLVCMGIFCLIKYLRIYGCRKLLNTWGVYLLIILLLALPQLLYWTFQQSSQSGFNTGLFNWGNLGDQYLWFYIKNWGVILLLLIPAVCYCSRKSFAVISASFLIWFIVELIAFSPNPYDNNKLLYVAYALFCCLCADYGITLYHKLKDIPGIRAAALLFLFLAGFSGILSISREMISDYLVYSNEQVEAAEYIEAHTLADDTFLTNDRHVNEVAALTGRNIVSGAGIYLGPHGIYDDARANDVRAMFESPVDSLHLYEQYDVDYVIISSWEKTNFNISEEAFASLFSVCFENEEMKIYQCGGNTNGQ